VRSGEDAASTLEAGTDKKRQSELEGTPVSLGQSKSVSDSQEPGQVKTSAVASWETYYVPARPTKQVLPNRRLLSTDALSETSDVAIEVGVDSRGRVTDARVISSDPPASLALLGIALDAAKQWRYRPATLQGHNVAARERIVFQFRR
jgi:TonB family protein